MNSLFIFLTVRGCRRRYTFLLGRPCDPMQQSASVSDAVTTGLPLDQLELDFKQFSLNLVSQALQGSSFGIFSLLPAFPICYFPLYLSAPVDWVA
jgi:hypothetical protein